jgi:hypothetical protein
MTPMTSLRSLLRDKFAGVLIARLFVLKRVLVEPARKSTNSDCSADDSFEA